MNRLHSKVARRSAVFSILLKVYIVISLIFTITPMSYHQSYVCNTVFTANVQGIKETRIIFMIVPFLSIYMFPQKIIKIIIKRLWTKDN